jgi:hypothetical protein
LNAEIAKLAEAKKKAAELKIKKEKQLQSEVNRFKARMKRLGLLKDL